MYSEVTLFIDILNDGSAANKLIELTDNEITRELEIYEQKQINRTLAKSFKTLPITNNPDDGPNLLCQDDDLKNILRMCFKNEPHERASIFDVQTCLNRSQQK
jgi:hypothetical protein